MSRLDEIEARVARIEKRNVLVEIDKAWETSWTRKILLMIFTYLTIGVYMLVIRVKAPWLNAIIPTIGFLLSTLTLPFFKSWWVNLHRNK